MSSSGDKQTQTITQTSLPPDYIKPQMEFIAGKSRELYNVGAGPQYFPGSTVIPFDWRTESAFNLTTDAIRNNKLNPAAYDTALNIMNRGGLSSTANNALGLMGNIASGANGITTGGAFGALKNTAANPLAEGAAAPLQFMRDIGSSAHSIGDEWRFLSELNRLQAPTAAEEHGTAVARGDFLGSNGNPFLAQLLDDQSGKIADQVNSQFSGSGRYGSGKHTEKLTDSIGRLRTEAMAGQYNRDRDAQMQAMGLIDSSRMAASDKRQQAISGYGNVRNMDINNRLNAAGAEFGARQNAYGQSIQNQLAALQGLTGVQGANIANQGNTAQTMANIGQNAQDESLRTALAAPALAETRYNDYARLADLGAQYEAKEAERLKDQIARFEFQNMQPWNQLGLLSGAVQGVNAGGTNTSVTQRPDLPLGQRILGGGMMGAGMGSMVGGPFGGLLGAAGGGLLGLL